MRLAIFSDLHLEWRDTIAEPIAAGDLSPLIAAGILPEAVEADAILNAGDTHDRPEIRAIFHAALQARYGVPVVEALGNHDVYGQPFPADAQGDLVVVAGRKIVCATLWTRLGPGDEAIASAFADFRKIPDLTVERWNRAHENQRAFLRAAEAEIVLTHHAPCRLSLDDRYAGSHDNAFYASEIDPFLFPQAKLWVHGHIHQPNDYQFGEIRVVCHPIGYPWAERARGFKIVEL